MSSEHDLFMSLAVAEAEKYIGATSPNPAVGACVVKDGKILALGAHVLAGELHAEVSAMQRAEKSFGRDALKNATLYTTLEPCNHTGKQPPCTQAIIASGIKNVFIGSADPNPNVKGGGADVLRNAGINVTNGCAQTKCDRLIAPFKKWITTGMPWVVHKLAYRLTKDGALSMIPDEGATTFTSEQCLIEAHVERKKSDAILTGIGTVLADFPKFNVRHVADHSNRKRYLVVMSVDGSEPPRKWVEQEWELGFEVLILKDLDDAFKKLGELGVHRVLVEAGPHLSRAITERKLWDEQLVFLDNHMYREYA